MVKRNEILPAKFDCAAANIVSYEAPDADLDRKDPSLRRDTDTEPLCRVWFWISVLSFLVWLFHSQASRNFVLSFWRLFAKFVLAR
jgi:hypothetical protein